MRRRHPAWLLLGVLLMLPGNAAAQEPGDEWEDEGWVEESSSRPELHGFVEAGAGTRLTRDPAVASDATLGELRLRLESDWTRERLRLAAKGDGLYDGILEEWKLSLRELALTVSPASTIDLRFGRQILTWGTGDLLFLNDLFAKDFESFFAGRSDDYLKAPETAVRLLVYGKRVNVDLVWTPVFEPDLLLDGERFSFFSAAAGALVAPNPPLRAVAPAKTLDNGELSLRLSRERQGVELAAYLHRGLFQQPRAFDAGGQPTFARLHAAGASVRRSAWGGLISGEMAYYDSVDDRRGDNPDVPNGQLRLLLGHERELARRLTGGFQYYVEWTLDHDELLAGSPSPEFEVDELRQVLTQRLTYLARQDRLRLSGFVFFSPSDRDGYLRGEVAYRIDDHWTVSGGVSLFSGSDVHTFFGQLGDNDNVFVRARYSF